MNKLYLIVSPCSPRPYPKKWAGLFEAKLNGRLICRSRQPLLDSARKLLAEGYDPKTTLVLRYVGSEVDAMTATIGAAAKLTVNERGPYFYKWEAPPDWRGPSTGSRIIDVNTEGAT
jgi:hypothetical protein